MDDITDFLVAGPNTVFLVAGCIVVGLFILELAMLAIGHSTMMDSGEVDFSLDANGNGIPDYLEHNLSMGDWFNPGHIPTTMFLVIFCGLLSIIGFSGQWIVFQQTGVLAPGLFVVPMVLVPTLALTRWATVGMAKIMPQDETNAILVESLTGNLGVLITGPIQGPDQYGMARFTDKHGVDHQLVVSSTDDVVIESGSSVMLLGPHPTNTFAYTIRKI